MSTKSKFFRVAVEGATTDGRNIERSWIEQIAKNYSRTKYGARIWMEHMRSIYADNQFGAYGDVLAVKAEEIDMDGKKKLALFAQIEPLPTLVNMTTKLKQKIYTSIEINPKFADTGEAYLMGLGVTDSPASLGTEILEFASKNPAASPFSQRKQAPENLFSAAVEVTLEFETEEDTSKFSTLLTGIKDKLAKFTGRSDDNTGKVLEVVNEMADGMGQLSEKHSATAAGLATLEKSFGTLQTEHKALQEQFKTIDTTDASKHSVRPPATGGAGKTLTDC